MPSVLSDTVGLWIGVVMVSNRFMAKSGFNLSCSALYQLGGVTEYSFCTTPTLISSLEVSGVGLGTNSEAACMNIIWSIALWM